MKEISLRGERGNDLHKSLILFILCLNTTKQKNLYDHRTELGQYKEWLLALQGAFFNTAVNQVKVEKKGRVQYC